MIYTLTLNPAIDYFMKTEETWIETEVNRATDIVLKAAGKGINVSIALDAMGIDSKAVAVLGGFSGNFIKEQISQYKHIELMEIAISEPNRINVKLHQEEKVLCVNAKGPKADKTAVEKILSLAEMVSDSDYVMVCGSMMQGFDEEFLDLFCKMIHEKGAKLILDMEFLSYEMLIKCKPYLIKPNLYEFKQIMNQKEMTDSTLVSYLNQIHQAGVANILLSLGAEGALLKTSQGLYRMSQKSIKAVNLVGCGDAMLAAFIGKLSVGCEKSEALRYAGAAGLATVSSMDTLTAERVKAARKEIQVSYIMNEKTLF